MESFADVASFGVSIVALLCLAVTLFWFTYWLLDGAGEAQNQLAGQGARGLRAARTRTAGTFVVLLVVGSAALFAVNAI